jgi:aryl-alcohol dehydrogenase-like predicted oxidoreductase
MIYKEFGKYNEEVSLLGFGCWGIGQGEWVGANDKESKEALIRAINEGVTFFDTALAYGNGHSEMLLGQAEKETGGNVFIASKIPSKKREWPAGDKSTLKESFPKKYIIEKTEQSLKNLNRDHVDLMQFHVWNDKWAKEDEWKEVITKLKKEGKVHYWGISINDHQSENGIEAGKTGLIDSFQVIFNIFDQKPVVRLFPFCRKNKIAVVARVPFDEGALTGNVRYDTEFPVGDFRNDYFRGKRRIEAQERADKIWEDVKDETDSLAEAALRYIISFNEVTTIIPGMRKEKNLLANIRNVEKGPLPPRLIEMLKIHKWNKNFYE